MASRRIARVEELLKRELSAIVQHEVKDPRIGFTTVTKITVSADLKHARAYVSIMGSDEEKAKSLEGLNSAGGYIQRELGRRVKLKFLPHIKFILDDSTDYGFHIMEILQKLKKEKSDEE